METFEIVLNEEEIFAGSFFFVSYSHVDTDVVREDVDALINRGVRLWIDHRNENDENMSLGDDWRDKVTPIETRDSSERTVERRFRVVSLRF